VHHKKGRPSAATLHESRPGKPSFLHLRSPPPRLASTCGRTDNSETQGLASPWDNILIPAQDATQRRGAATARREAGLGAKGVTKITMATRTSKTEDSDPPAPKRHKRCKPDGREYGHNAHHPHPWQAQPAATIGPYPYNTSHAAAPTWHGRNSTAKAQAPNPACTRPSLRGGTRASPLGPRT